MRWKEESITLQLLIRGEHDTGKCEFCKEKETVEHDEDMSQTYSEGIEMIYELKKC